MTFLLGDGSVSLKIEIRFLRRSKIDSYHQFDQSLIILFLLFALLAFHHLSYDLRLCECSISIPSQADRRLHCSIRRCRHFLELVRHSASHHSNEYSIIIRNFIIIINIKTFTRSRRKYLSNLSLQTSFTSNDQMWSCFLLSLHSTLSILRYRWSKQFHGKNSSSSKSI